jgi:hypothetical protein
VSFFLLKIGFEKLAISKGVESMKQGNTKGPRNKKICGEECVK